LPYRPRFARTTPLAVRDLAEVAGQVPEVVTHRIKLVLQVLASIRLSDRRASLVQLPKLVMLFSLNSPRAIKPPIRRSVPRDQFPGVLNGRAESGRFIGVPSS